MKLPYRTLSIAVGLLACGLAAAPLCAAPEPPRAASAALIKDLTDLKELDQKLVAIADKSAAATVSLISTKGMGAGSGVIVDSSGIILSAAHVLSALAGDVIVLFPDGKRAVAKALGADFTRDAAMLQITDPGEYPFAELADPESPPINSWCVALGHPGGFDPLRTPPLRLGRVLYCADFLVTDCTVVAGDSGGPLFDTDGRVIGIHSNIGSGLSENRHVPIKVFRDQWDDLLAGKRSGTRFDQRAKPPATPAPTPAALGLKLGKESPDGLTIVEVEKDSRAAKAGLLAGDVIVRVAAVKITTTKELAEALAKPSRRGNLTLTYRREGEEKRARIPTQTPAPAQPEGEQPEQSKPNDKPDDKLIQELRERAKANGGRLQVTPEEVAKLGGVRRLAKLLDLPAVSDDFFQSILAALKPVAAPASAFTATVLADGKGVALGTVVSADGGILTKDSETTKGAVSVGIGGKTYPATLVRRFPEWDLALFHIDADQLRAVDLSADQTPARGSLLTVPGPAAEPLGIGMVSVNSRPLGKIGFLGVQTETGEKSVGGALVRMVINDGPAAKAGVKEGDLIVSLNGQLIPNSVAFTQTVVKLKVDETVKLGVLRDGAKQELEIKLGERPMPAMGGDFLKMNRMSGPLSPKINGFPLALQHDIPLEPAQCGGPLIDLEGRCIGINVARAGRVNSLAIPAGKIAGLLAGVYSEHAGKTAARPPAAPAVTAEDIARLNRSLEEIQRSLKAIEKRLDAADARRTDP
jgi:serine protease Do